MLCRRIDASNSEFSSSPNPDIGAGGGFLGVASGYRSKKSSSESAGSSAFCLKAGFQDAATAAESDDVVEEGKALLKLG